LIHVTLLALGKLGGAQIFGKFVHPWNKASQQTLQITKNKKIMVCDQIISGDWPHPFRANCSSV
jgi:hypothetical protein